MQLQTKTGDIEIRFGSGNSAGNFFATGLHESPALFDVPTATSIPGYSAVGLRNTWPTNSGVRFKANSIIPRYDHCV